MGNISFCKKKKNQNIINEEEPSTIVKFSALIENSLDSQYKIDYINQNSQESVNIVFSSNYEITISLNNLKYFPFECHLKNIMFEHLEKNKTCLSKITKTKEYLVKSKKSGDKIIHSIIMLKHNINITNLYLLIDFIKLVSGIYLNQLSKSSNINKERLNNISLNEKVDSKMKECLSNSIEKLFLRNLICNYFDLNQLENNLSHFFLADSFYFNRLIQNLNDKFTNNCQVVSKALNSFRIKVNKKFKNENYLDPEKDYKLNKNLNEKNVFNNYDLLLFSDYLTDELAIIYSKDGNKGIFKGYNQEIIVDITCNETPITIQLKQNMPDINSLRYSSVSNSTSQLNNALKTFKCISKVIFRPFINEKLLHDYTLIENISLFYYVSEGFELDKDCTLPNYWIFSGTVNFDWKKNTNQDKEYCLYINCKSNITKIKFVSNSLAQHSFSIGYMRICYR